MTLDHLIANLSDYAGIAFDSRRVGPGYVFVAVKGTRVDGHDFIDAAIENGAVVIVGEDLSPGPSPGERGVVQLTVDDSSKALALLADAYHAHPSRDLKLVGVTGTNGKTTICTLLHELFTGLGYRAGLLSTVEVRIGKEVYGATHTTPDALAINERLAEMRDAGCDYVFMEVSSHAVDQERIFGLDFDGGIFTNLSHDHLDYHETFDAYLKAKKTFFDRLPKTAFALTNLDDRRGEVMLQNTKAKKQTYSLRRIADFRARVLDNNAQGLHLDIDGTEVFTRMLGRFNAYNFLGAYAGAVLLGQANDESLVVLSQLTGAAGRLEAVTDPSGKVTAVVDYAHTPDALENVLSTLQTIATGSARVICVVGAGGDRDAGKRAEMGRITASLADQTIFTNDNPRSEDPGAILAEVEAGVTADRAATVLTIADRRNAIRTAVRLARPGDIVLVAGKGHETYQEIAGERHPFSDKEELAAALQNLSHAH